MADYHPFETPDDPAETFRRLREDCPVHRFEAGSETIFTLSRHDDVREMFGDAGSWSGRYGQGAARSEEPGIRTDAPEHTTYRRMLNRVLAAHVVRTRTDDIRAIAEAVIDGLPAGGGDLLDDLAAVIPSRVFAPVLGVEAAEVRELWALTLAVLSHEADNAGQALTWEETKARPAWRAAYALTAPWLRRRRAAKPATNDLLSVMAEARDERGVPLPDDALVQVVMLVLFGAVHTAATLLTNAVLRLLEHRARWEALCDDPTLAAAVIEESVRFDTPVPGIFRTARGEQTVHGVRIANGAKVRGLFAAANRDPAAFDRPDEFHLDRDPVESARRHLGFGLGIHACAGAPLARLEGRIVLETLARRRPQLHLNGECRWWRERNSITLLARHALAPVTW